MLKDFVNKSHAQRGYFTPYVPGWDCHGQPIEHMVEVTLGPDKMKETPQPELRRLCREWATKYVGIQRDGFKRLGVNADWDHPYLTYIPNFEAGNVEIFRDMYLKGQVYRGPQAHPLVQEVPYGSCRGRNRILRRGFPVRLREVQA